MKRIVLRYGLISGVILIALSSITLPLCLNGTLDMGKSQLLGYSIMVLAFLAVFFGVRSYRDQQNGGTITFGKAFQVGILIALVTCVMYVVAWEIVFWGFIPDFGDKYATIALEKMQKDGASPDALAKARTEMETFKKLYRNPLFNIGMTFMEVFPVGLIMSLVAAAILRRRTPDAKLATA